MKKISQEFSSKLEEMLVIPFMVVLYSRILVPLVILCYQGYTLLRTGEWAGLTLDDLAMQINIDLSVLHEPGWSFIKNIFLSFLEWPLALSVIVILFIGGWILILVFCVFAKIVMDNEPEEEQAQESGWATEIKENYSIGQYPGNNTE